MVNMSSFNLLVSALALWFWLLEPIMAQNYPMSSNMTKFLEGMEKCLPSFWFEYELVDLRAYSVHIVPKVDRSIERKGRDSELERCILKNLYLLSDGVSISANSKFESHDSNQLEEDLNDVNGYRPGLAGIWTFSNNKVITWRDHLGDPGRLYLCGLFLLARFAVVPQAKHFREDFWASIGDQVLKAVVI